MATLPPYSTFRTNTKQQIMFPQATSHGNVLCFTPPGFKQSLYVKFPDSRLAVCENCKKNFKTRDMCRVRNRHTEAPWTTAYICISIDSTCIDQHGQYVDKPMVLRMVPWQPYCATQSLHKKTPVCASCKKTNRTRSFCRERHKHRALPWCTVYVLMSTMESVDPQTVVAAPSKPVGEKSKEDDNEYTRLMNETGTQKTDDGDDDPVNVRTSNESPPVGSSRDEASVAESKTSDLSENVSPGDESRRLAEFEGSDDFNDIAESRTCLVKVSSSGISVTWLELTESDETFKTRLNLGPALVEHPQYQQYPPPIQHPPHAQSLGMEPSAFHHPSAYAVHQNSMKVHQQQYFHQMQQQQRHQQPYNPQWQYPPHQPPMYGYRCPQHPPMSSAPHPARHYAPFEQSPAPGMPSPLPAPTPVTGFGTPVPAPAPVTAGEAAAAEQQKRARDAEEGRDSSSPAIPTPPLALPQLHHPHIPQGMVPPPPQLGHQRLAAVPQNQQHQYQWMAAAYQPMNTGLLPPQQMAHYGSAGSMPMPAPRDIGNSPNEVTARSLADSMGYTTVAYPDPSSDSPDMLQGKKHSQDDHEEAGDENNENSSIKRQRLA